MKLKISFTFVTLLIFCMTAFSQTRNTRDVCKDLDTLSNYVKDWEKSQVLLNNKIREFVFKYGVKSRISMGFTGYHYLRKKDAKSDLKEWKKKYSCD